MQHRLSPGRLLNEKGNLIEAGYAYQLDKEYSRKDIKANGWRIKEWDYYFIGNKDYGIAFTVADNSYMSLISISYLDFNLKTNMTKNFMDWFTFGKLNLPSSSKQGDIVVENKNYSVKFLIEGVNRHLIVRCKDFADGKDFSCDVVLEPTIKDTMVIATPFEKEKHFYYNQKINCLNAKGSFQVGDHRFSLDGNYGVLDWGRGVWRYKNTWYWSSMNTELNGKPIGFNLGYGFGDTSAASENMFFYNNLVYKLEEVRFEIALDDKGKEKYMEPWRFASPDGRIDMDFIPDLDRYSGTDIVIIKSIQHQVFGKFSGYLMAGDEKVEFRNLPGFAEKVFNCW